ncbi:hypothetical protein [Streptomyces sp. NPDC001450]
MTWEAAEAVHYAMRGMSAACVTGLNSTADKDSGRPGGDADGSLFATGWVWRAD